MQSELLVRPSRFFAFLFCFFGKLYLRTELIYKFERAVWLGFLGGIKCPLSALMGKHIPFLIRFKRPLPWYAQQLAVHFFRKRF